MTSTLSIMKTTWKQRLAFTLILAVAAAPLGAETVKSSDTVTNPTIPAPAVAPPDAPTPPAPPAPDNDATTNKSPAKEKKTDHSADHPAVQIGPSGIHIGGPNPVDIESGFGAGHSGNPFTDTSFTEAVIAIVAILSPFVFCIVLGALFFYFRFRRQRILHETLRAMIDKGVPIPPELITGPGVRRRTKSDLRSGLIMLAFGAGLLLLLHSSGGAGRIGWIPILIGVAFLVTWFIEKKDNNNSGTTNK
jgi:hypothetical protein